MERRFPGRRSVCRPLDAKPSPEYACLRMDAPHTPDDAAAVAGLLRALADENRLRMLAIVEREPACVCHIAQALGLSQPHASQHLLVLRRAGLVSRERRGTWIWYGLAVKPTGVAATDALVQAAIASVRATSACAQDRERLIAARDALPCP